MRPIKFRAWFLNSLDHQTCSVQAGETLLEFLQAVEDVKNEYVLMQFTGLHDKNGKEVYEGDLVKWLGHEVQNGKQIRPKRLFCVKWDFHVLFQLQNIIEGNLSAEVIGNIYETPELEKENSQEA